MSSIVTRKEYLQNLSKDVIDMHNPLCIKCNECCTITAQITKEEYDRLMALVATGENKKIYQQGMNRIKRYYRKNTLYMMCPFTDEDTKKCRIYDDRPQICKSFHCSCSKKIKNPEAHLTIADLFFEH